MCTKSAKAANSIGQLSGIAQKHSKINPKGWVIYICKYQETVNFPFVITFVIHHLFTHLLIYTFGNYKPSRSKTFLRAAQTQVKALNNQQNMQ